MSVDSVHAGLVGLRLGLPSHVRVEPWQALELEQLGLTQREVEAAVWWLEDHPIADSRNCQGAMAIGRALFSTHGTWRVVGWLILYPPLSWIARPVYAIVAANRHRLSRMVRHP